VSLKTFINREMKFDLKALKLIILLNYFELGLSPIKWMVSKATVSANGSIGMETIKELLSNKL